MKRLSFVLLLLALTPSPSFADSVPVLWKVRFTTPNGSFLSQPSPAYIRNLEACGHRPNLNAQLNLVPVSTLRCHGVLQFTSSRTIRKRIENRIHLAEKRGHRAVKGLPLTKLRQQLAIIDFAISPYGIFHSGQDGLGNARRIGLNISEAKLVILNKPYWDQLINSSDADAFLLHEALGALNYEDTDYSRSNLLYSMSKTDHTPGDGDDADDTPIQVAERGGASVVGRGGDSDAQFFKASLLLLADKEVRISGADAKLTPTKAELKKVINESPVTILPYSFFKNQSTLCTDPSTGAESRLTCGGFMLKGANGKPFLLISEEWASFSQGDKAKLLLKIFQNLVSELVRLKQEG